MLDMYEYLENMGAFNGLDEAQTPEEYEAEYNEFLRVQKEAFAQAQVDQSSDESDFDEDADF
jgi:hypothetical protein